MSGAVKPRQLDTSPLDRLAVEAAYPREAVQDVLDGIDVALLLDLTKESKDKLIAWKKRISVRVDHAADTRRRLLETKASIDRLITDGHPGAPKGLDDERVAQEIDAKLASLRRARGRFTAASDEVSP